MSRSAVAAKTLLLVDDDEDFLAGMAAMLARRGFQVLTGASAEEGLKLAKEAKPDLFILDVAMSGMDGYALCAALKEDDKTFDTPVIFLSAMDQAGDMLRGYYAGAHEYLTKPVNMDQLVRQITKLLGG